MGSRIFGIGPLFLAALLGVENNTNSQKIVTPKITPLTPVSKRVSSDLVKQGTNNNQQVINIVQNFLGGANLNPVLNFQRSQSVPEYIEPEVSKDFRSFNGFQKREEYLTNVLEVLNPHLLQRSNIFGKETALSEFNKKHNVNFQCLAIRGKPCEFVFIDNNYFLKSGIGKTNIPRRISISLEEAQAIQPKQDVFNLLEKKLTEHDALYNSENVMWNTPFSFDFPKNKGACMIALELNPDKGMETDVVYSLDVYVKEFGMSPYALSVGTKHVNDMHGVLLGTEYGDLSDIFVPATKDSILTNLRKSLRRAVDEGKEFFVFHYLTHGSSEGKICAEDKQFDPREISEAISELYKGEPLCSKLDIYIQAGACYSGKQLESIVDFFKWGKNKDIPVKNLYIVSEANNTTAVFSTSWQKTSLILDNPIVCDMTGPQAYYDSWVKEYANYLKTKGLEIRPEVTSMLWRFRFADLMTWYDEKQNMKGFHYSNNPRKNKVIERYFTETKPVIGVNDYMQNLA